MADREVFVNKVTVPSSSGTITAKLVDSVSGYTKYNYFEIPISYDSANQRYYVTGITWQNIIDAYNRGDYIYGRYGNNIYVMTYYTHDAQETFLKLENFTTGQNSITTDGFTVEDLTNLVRRTSDVSGGGGGTVTSVGLSNATDGGLSISGSPITSSGSITVGHSNVLSGAQSTQAVYPVTIDKNGHIASYGTAVTIPTVTSSYSSTGTNAVNGIAVNAALQTLDSSISSTTGQAISAITITDGKIASSSKINVGETNQNAFSNVKVGSTTIAADSKTDTLELVAGTNITLTPDATNDTITISSTGGGGGGSYTATSPVDITNNVISLEDSYGDIQNPYGAKNEHYVLAGNPSVTNYTDSWVSGALSEYLPVEEVTLVAGTYNFSATVDLNAQGISDDPEIVPPTPAYDVYLGVTVNGDLIEVGDSVEGTGAISETLSVNFELSSAATVDIFLITSSDSYGTVEGSISDQTLTSSIPALPTFRALTTEDLPDGAINAWYGTSFTMSTNAAKLVACDGYKLARGSIIGVLFSASNTTATPTLNVNNTGAKSIYIGNSTPNSTTNVLKWSTNTMIYFMYDGDNYRYITSISGASTVPSRGANTWFGTSSTSASTAAKTSTIDNFVLTKGAVVYITFSTANTYVGGTLTLNINSTGAKNIYYNNAVTSTTNTLLWDAKEMLTFVYSGSYWYFAGKSLQSGGGGGGSYTATSPIDITSDVISLSDGYGDIKNPYGVKNEHYVLAGGSSSVIATYNDITTSNSSADIDDSLSIEAGTYILSAHVVAGSSSGSKNITLVCFLNGNYATSTALTGTGAIDTDVSVEFTSATATTVEMWVALSGTRVSTTFSNIKVSNANPAYPEFRALTNNDLPAIGNIQNTGALQATDVTIATGDKLVVTDVSDSNKVARASISFDTTNTTAYLRKDGTWATPSGGGGDAYRITLSHNSSTDEYSIDRTYAEVEAAVRANKYVYIYDNTGTIEAGYQGSTIVAPFSCMAPTEDWFFFDAIAPDYNSEEQIIRYVLADDGVWVDQWSLARELPYVNTSDNGKVLKVVNGAWSAATESSGGGLFLVNFSLGATLGSYTADKSFAQIVSAIDSGSVVMGQYQGEYFSLTYFYEGDEQTDGDVRFERYSNNLGSIEWFGMDSQGQITYGNESPWEDYTDNAIGNAMAASY